MNHFTHKYTTIVESQFNFSRANGEFIFSGEAILSITRCG